MEKQLNSDKKVQTLNKKTVTNNEIKKTILINENKKIVKSQETKKILSFNEWKNIDLRVGLIELIEELPNKDKLYKLTVDFGGEKRSVIAGIKPFYTKEELLGKKSVFVFNLAPAKLAGVESSAMILGALASDGKYKVFFSDENIQPGTRIE